MSDSTSRLLQDQLAADRRINIGQLDALANPLTWSTVLTLPTGYTWRAGRGLAVTSAVLMGGGNSSAPILYRRTASTPWRNVTANLPAAATADVQAIAGWAATWWAAGRTAAGGGWLAISTDDGLTWSDLTVAAGITKPINSLANVATAILYVGCNDGKLHKWTALGWTDLSTALAFGADDVLGIAVDGAAGIMVIGGDTTPTFTCKHSANAGVAWTDRTAALAAINPVRAVLRIATNAFLVGGNVLKATYDAGATWENWAVHPDASLLYPIYALAGYAGVYLIGSNVGLIYLAHEGYTLTALTLPLTPARALAATTANLWAGGNTELKESASGGTVIGILPYPNTMQLRPSKAAHAQGAGAHTIRAGPGQLVSLLLSTTDVTQQNVTLHDNTAANGAILAVIHLPANAAPLSWSPVYPIQFTTGLTINLTTNLQDVTLIYV